MYSVLKPDSLAMDSFPFLWHCLLTKALESFNFFLCSFALPLCMPLQASRGHPENEGFLTGSDTPGVKDCLPNSRGEERNEGYQAAVQKSRLLKF